MPDQYPSDINCLSAASKTSSMQRGPQNLAGESLVVEFERLAEVWRKETEHISLIRDKVANPAYLSIIGLGPLAVPLILKELRDHPSHWFAALQALTKVDPANTASSPREARDRWLSWGNENGLI